MKITRAILRLEVIIFLVFLTHSNVSAFNAFVVPKQTYTPCSDTITAYLAAGMDNIQKRDVTLAGSYHWSVPTISESLEKPSLEDFTGYWIYTNSKSEEQQRRREIEAVTNEVPSFMRGIARKRLIDQTAPPRKFKLEVDGNQFKIVHDGIKISLTFNAKPKTIEQNGEKGKISVRYDGEHIIVVSKGENGRRVSKYELTPDRNQLAMYVEIVSERLNKPLAFQATYRRK
jgi:hypothetical protein